MPTERDHDCCRKTEVTVMTLPVLWNTAFDGLPAGTQGISVHIAPGGAASAKFAAGAKLMTGFIFIAARLEAGRKLSFRSSCDILICVSALFISSMTH